MTKLEFLKWGFARRLYQKKIWLTSLVSVLTDTPRNTEILKQTPGAFHRDAQGGYFIDPETNETHRITDVPKDRPLFYKHDRFDIDASWMNQVKGTITTTFGIYLLNKVVLWEAFKDKVPYENGVIDKGFIKKVIDRLMVSNPIDGSPVPDDRASVAECLRVTHQANYLEGFNEIFVKAASIQSLTVSKNVIALRERLFKENADKLTDPVVVADIIKQVVDADYKEQMAGDSRDFFIDKKFIDNARKKMFLIFGLERNFETGEYKLIKTPLNENWDRNEITHYINTAVAASYDRGKSTGEGGADVNALILLTSRMRIAEDDCGSIKTEEVSLVDASINGWIGCSFIKGKELVKITHANKAGLIGQIVNMRVPQYCQTKHGDFCKTCCGDKLGGSPAAISAEVVYIATNFMLIKMKNAHVSKVDTITLTLEELFD